MEQPPAPEPEHKPTSWLMIVMVVLILAGFALTGYYGVRVLRSYRLLHRAPLRPGVTDVSQVRGWMTIPYIARAYRVPEDLFWQGLGIPAEHNRFKSLRALDREYAGGQPGAVLNRVKALILQYEIQHPPPTPPSQLSMPGRPGQPHPLTRLRRSPSPFHGAGDMKKLCSLPSPSSRRGEGRGGVRLSPPTPPPA